MAHAPQSKIYRTHRGISIKGVSVDMLGFEGNKRAMS